MRNECYKDQGTALLAKYTKDGEFVRTIHLDEEKISWCGGVSMTMEGHIAVTVFMPGNPKVMVF